MRLAYKNLLNDKTRLILTVSGVALAVMLILLLNGFLTGMNHQITSYLDNSPGTIVVAQSGVSNLLGATSLLPARIVEQAREIEAVSQVLPIQSLFVILELHDKKQPAYLIGYEPELGGGPWRMAEGRSIVNRNEVVLDSALAKRHNVRVGESLQIMGSDFSVVGLSSDTTSWMTSYFFIRKDAAETLLLSPGATSFLLVTAADGASTEAVQQKLNGLDGVEAHYKTTIARNDLKLFAKVFSAPLRLMIGIAFLVGSLVLGLVIYTATIERMREYGVLKAIGARNGILYKVIVVQAVIAATAGTAIGVPLVYLAGELIMLVRPEFLILQDPRNIILAVVGGLSMALAGALVPARLIAGLAPAEVFRK